MSLMSALLAGGRPDPTVWVGPGLLGFVVIVAIGVVTYLLWRSMNKQIKRVDFEDGKARATDRAADRGREHGDGPDDSSSSAP